ncbi:hypothetical protein M9Y10_012747 [Tritrichomonas musculus]|uniref:Protein kinase domain-containing protein n=1 Tax=Tritrichomonas musculus TaxID=1915356 RepID=A0ABR2ID96_9EUKA
MENNEESNQYNSDSSINDQGLNNIYDQEINQDDDFVIRLPQITDRFVTIKEIGKGRYGTVQKCKDKVTGEIVAVKKIIKHENKSINFQQTTIREVKLLRELKHPNIIDLKFVVETEDSEKTFYLVEEYCEYDLCALLHKKSLDINHLKSIMKQFLIVLQYCAGQNVIHRDLKPANMFITKNGFLKLGDFGFARKIKNKGRYTNTIITQWYRPPEIIILNSQPDFDYKYKTEVDIWSAGCILYEMVTGKPLFKAKLDSDISQLDAIYSICGPLPGILFEKYKNIAKGDLFEMCKKENRYNLKDYLESKFKDTEFISLIPLLLQMLNLNPEKRISAEDALNDPFFREIGSSYEPLSLPEIDEEEIHQKEASESKKKKSASIDRIDEVRPPKKLPSPPKI